MFFQGFRLPVLLALAAVFFGACASPISLDSPQAVPEGQGQVVVTFGSQVRNLVSDVPLTIGSLQILFEATGQTPVELLVNPSVSTSGSANLAAGTWTVTARAYNTENVARLIGQASTTVEVSLGAVSQVNLSLAPIEGLGTLNLSASWPGITLTSPSLTGTLTKVGASSSLPLTFTVSGQTASLSRADIPNGYYRMALSLKDGSTERAHPEVDAVHIVTGGVTSGTLVFRSNGSSGEENGDLDLEIDLDLQVPETITFTGQVAAMTPSETMTVTAQTAKTPDAWTWLLNGEPIAGATTASRTFGPLAKGLYRVDAVAKHGTKLSSHFFTFAVVDPNQIPTVSASPAGGTFTGASVSVTLSAANPASGQYKIDSGEWTSFTTGQQLSLGASLTEGQSVSLSLKNGTVTADYVYTKAAPAGVTIYYKGATAPVIHVWKDTNPDSDITTWASRPTMQAAGVEGYWKYTIPSQFLPITSPLGVIFTVNGSQSADIPLPLADIEAGRTTRDGSAWVTAPVLPASVSAAPGTSTFTSSSLMVSLSAANPASGEYQIGTGGWVAYNHGAQIAVGAGLTVGQTVTLNLRNGSATASYTYTKAAQPTGLIIGYKKAGTTAPTLWVWEVNGRPISANAGHSWPGPAMTANPENAGWWTWTVPETFLPIASGGLAMKFDSGAEIALSAADITAGKTWRDTGTNTWILPLVTNPTVSATPGTSSFSTASLSVTLNASNPANGEYQIGTGTWTAFTNGTQISVGAGLSVGQSVTLNVRNGATANASYTYTKSEAPSGLTIGFKAATQPSIWVWELAGRAITELAGFTWNTQPKMTDEGNGWWSWTIPNTLLPVNKDLVMKFNSGANVTLNLANQTAAKTWYDNGTWVTKPAPQPKVPKIVINPEGGWFETSQSVTITITDDPVAGATTSAFYTRNGGAATAITGGSATVNLTDTTNLAVSATNSAGTATANASFTKGVAPQITFSWDNALVYFVLTDRFFDGNPANNNSYGRPQVDATGKNIGTFHGGDIAGLTSKLNSGYFTDLGVNALWITAPYEQAHGWVGGGSDGDFAHYAYHGYYALDFSNIDANMGTKDEFRTFVRTAHSKGIRVILDIVLNHSGYPTLKDMQDFGFNPTTNSNFSWTPSSGQNWFGYHDAVIDYNNSTEWGKWWGGWVRAGLPGYTQPGGDDLTKTLAFLPDFKTEDSTARGLPTFLANKATFGGAFFNYNAATAKTQQKRVRDWIVEWLTQWVREYGIDGFRIDTAKHVEMDSWIYLKNQGKAALTAWRAAEALKPLADRDPAWSWTDEFWTTAEVWGHGPNQSNYHTSGAFDSVINFNFQGAVGSMLGNAGSTVSTWGSYAGNVNSSTAWNTLSYISSHDTGAVFYNGQDLRQQQAGTALVLLPGGVQIFYGDELGRVNGNGGSDKDQGSRSSIDWGKQGNAIHQHWQKVGQFRRNNIAVGAGQQTTLTASSGSAVGRTWTRNSTVNKVAIVVGANGSTSVQVGSLWTDGTLVRNAYTGATATVTGGSVSFTPGAVDGLILIEKVQ